MPHGCHFHPDLPVGSRVLAQAREFVSDRRQKRQTDGPPSGHLPSSGATTTTIIINITVTVALGHGIPSPPLTTTHRTGERPPQEQSTTPDQGRPPPASNPIAAATLTPAHQKPIRPSPASVYRAKPKAKKATLRPGCQASLQLFRGCTLSGSLGDNPGVLALVASPPACLERRHYLHRRPPLRRAKEWHARQRKPDRLGWTQPGHWCSVPSERIPIPSCSGPCKCCCFIDGRQDSNIDITSTTTTHPSIRFASPFLLLQATQDRSLPCQVKHAREKHPPSSLHPPDVSRLPPKGTSIQSSPRPLSR